MRAILTIILLFFITKLYSQCCGAGSANPIASDLSQSVLQYQQFEINSNFQYVYSSRFLNYTKPDTLFLSNYQSNYLYSRFSYGLTKVLTFSVEFGYWLKKSQRGKNNTDGHSSSGISDIILFPKLNIYNKNNLEITSGFGLKIPVGSHHDSTRYYEPFSGEYFYLIKPPVMQNSNGSNDFIFNLLMVKKLKKSNWRLLSSMMYLHKGWNPSGEKFGDLFTFSIFGGKTFNYKLTVLTYLKYEWVDKMSYNKDIFSVAFPNYDPDATGSHKVFIIPQVNYAFKEIFSFYLSSEIPVYQYVNKTQIASQFMFNAGISYRFKLKKSDIKE